MNRYVICEKIFTSNRRAKTCSEECRYKRKLQTNKKYLSKKEVKDRYKNKYLSTKKKCDSKWYKLNKSKKLATNSRWKKDNKDYVNSWYREYKSNREKEDINFKIKNNLRTRLWHAIKNNQKVGSAIEDLGCSIEELKKHLESQFQEGMNWGNYGEWHIDHIEALANFDLTNYSELRKACNYSNLQPLWAEDNLKKGY